jgi:hypothetical protein
MWSEGYAEWTDETTRTAYMSIAFTWLLNHAAQRALSYRMLGWRVIAGGPALFQLKMYNVFHDLADFVEVGTSVPDVVTRTTRTRRSPAEDAPARGRRKTPDPCGHCIVPRMWGTKFTLLSDFVPRPVLCDDNLSALPPDYQDFIIRRYQEAGVKLRDANSGFEPVTFTPEVYRRWKPILAAGGSPGASAWTRLPRCRRSALC